MEQIQCVGGPRVLDVAERPLRNTCSMLRLQDTAHAADLVQLSSVQLIEKQTIIGFDARALANASRQRWPLFGLPALPPWLDVRLVAREECPCVYALRLQAAALRGAYNLLLRREATYPVVCTSDSDAVHGEHTPPLGAPMRVA